MTDALALYNALDRFRGDSDVRAATARILGNDAPTIRDIKNADDEQVRDLQNYLAGAAAGWADRYDLDIATSVSVHDELHRLRIRARAREIHEAETSQLPDDMARFINDGSILLDLPEGTPAVVGDGSEVLWSIGEPSLIVGPSGVGKTTVTGQIVGALIAPEPTKVLGWPVQQRTRVLYMACDRPRQIKRSLRRHLGHLDRDRLADRLQIWNGPPPADFGRDPEALVKLCQSVEADTVVIDSLKDVAVGLVEDAVGATLNRALQLAVVEGVEVLGLHHQRKGQNGAKPKALEDVYGSTWITAGAGSVVLLWGQPGDPIVELTHLKQPADPIGPLKLEHDHDNGITTAYRGFDPLGFLRGRREAGATATEAAAEMFEKSKPTVNERAKAKRKLEKLVREGLATASGAEIGGAGGTSGKRYFFIDAHTDAGVSAG